ncbi:hypothetical protein [Dellaglioa algida]|uniref:hypothetical protein n=1 Tax=Dellaglioa algida TaxID=105612 RepID=UPI0024C47C34|nr:hypothetical protein [Dellaglioa algida]MDK1727845.1 hypothetical protein [Dellaglioa algida]MDK1737175.1 hypothetical protein [Dellaglioa algida]
MASEESDSTKRISSSAPEDVIFSNNSRKMEIDHFTIGYVKTSVKISLGIDTSDGW